MAIALRRRDVIAGGGLIAVGGILVACGTGSYSITAIQLPVGKGAILNPADVLNGRTDIIHAGVTLGSRIR